MGIFFISNMQICLQLALTQTCVLFEVIYSLTLVKTLPVIDQYAKDYSLIINSYECLHCQHYICVYWVVF